MLKKHNKHGPMKWFASVLAAAGLLLALPAAQPVYAAGDTGTSDATVQTSYAGFSAVSDVKVNNVSVRQYGKYSLTFNANGGKGDMTSESGQKLLDDRITLTNKYTKTGYTFTGWDTKADGSGTDYKNKQVVTADDLGVNDGGSVTLYAQWRPNTYTIRFEAGINDTTGTMADQKFTYDESAVLDNGTFIKDGYQLIGWKTSDGKTYENMAVVRNLSSKDSDQITLTGVWQKGIAAGKATISSDVHGEHVWVTKYDDTKHWEECSICHAKKNEEPHQLVEYWTNGGPENCDWRNVHRHVCACGYEHEDLGGHDNVPKKAEHKFDSYIGASSGHCKHCSVCGNNTDWFAPGKDNYPRNRWPEHDPYFYEPHRDAGGILGDTTGRSGTCSICGQQVSPFHVVYASLQTENDKRQYGENKAIVECNSGDGFELMDPSKSTCSVSYSSGKLIGDAVFYIMHPVNIANSYPTPVGVVYSSRYTYNSAESSASFIDNRHLKLHVVFNDSGEGTRIGSLGYAGGWFTFTDGSMACSPQLSITIPPEGNAPVISDFSTFNGEKKDGWTTGTSIHISGTEDSSQQVHIQIRDDNGKIYEDDDVPVVNGKFDHTIRPDLTADDNGMKLHAVVRDDWYNQSKADTSVSNIDTTPPVLLYTIDYSGKWAKSRTITIKATDNEGSGDVKIGINSLEDLKGTGDKDAEGKPYVTKSGSNFERTYTFIGDKYNDDTYLVVLQDAAGNVSTTAINVGYLDNTNPEVLVKDVNGLNVTVSADDLNKAIVDSAHSNGTEGSGVKKFGYLNTGKDKNFTWLNADEVDTTSSGDKVIVLPKSGSYLIAVMDEVGNISTPKHVTVEGSTSAKRNLTTIFNSND